MWPGLRSKILVVTVLTPAILAGAVLLTVHRNVREHVRSTSIHENLEHSATVFESMLSVRLRALTGGARVIAQDPRFFSLVMLGPTQRDPRFVATVKGMANDFNRITRTDLFEVFDRSGRVLAAVGERRTEPAARDSLLKRALHGAVVAGVLAQDHEHYQVAVTPVRADGHIVGALLLGAEIGAPLAEELKGQMRSEVTFLSHGRVTGTTLSDPRDVTALLKALATSEFAPARLSDQGVVQWQGATQTYLTLLRPIPGAPLGRQQFYVMQRSYDPETSFQRRMQRDLLLLGLVGVLVALLTGFVFSRQITSPILALVRGARSMEEGDFDTPVIVRNRDEIGYLAERFRVMRERERAYVSSLEEAARLKSEFISIASHELRTPISVIQGYRDLLADGSLGDLGPRQQQALNAIKDCLRQLTKVAEDATHVAQIEGERIVLASREAPLAPLVEQAIGQALAAATGRQLTVTSELQPDLGEARVDPARVVQCLTHLVANGIRFTPDGGRVTVRGHGTREFVVLQVSDTGMGIPADQLDHIFDRSMLLRDARQHHSSSTLEYNSAGMGFGLAIVRGIVEAHGGTVDAASAPDKGTLFTIRLPRAGVASQSLAA